MYIRILSCFQVPRSLFDVFFDDYVCVNENDMEFKMVMALPSFGVSENWLVGLKVMILHNIDLNTSLLYYRKMP